MAKGIKPLKKTVRIPQSSVPGRTVLEGLAEFILALRGIKRQHIAGLTKGMLEGASVIFEESQRLIPVEHGPLKASGKVIVLAVGEKAKIEISYSEPYAMAVHEVKEYAHGQDYNVKYADDIAAGRKTAREPQEVYKFLEKAIRRKRKAALEAAAKNMKRLRR